MMSLPSHVTAGMSDDSVNDLGMIASRVQQLQKQGMPQNQIAAAIQQEITTVPNMIPLANAFALYNWLKTHPASVQPPNPDSIAVSMAKQITQQDQQAKMAQMARAQAQMQQQMPQGAPMPQGAAPQQPMPPQQAPMPMREGGIASLPVYNVGDEKAYASGGIVAFDEGGNIEAQFLTQQQQQMLANAANQQAMARQQQLQQGLSQLITPTQDVRAAAHGGPIRHYDGNDGSLVDSNQLFGGIVNTPYTKLAFGPTIPASYLLNTSNADNTASSAGTSSTTSSGQNKLGLQIRDPNVHSYASIVDEANQKYKALTTGDPDIMDEIKKREKELGVGKGFQRYMQIHGDAIAEAEKNYQLSNQLAGQAGQAAGIEQASKTGRDPGYAGTGLSGLLASIGANISAANKARMESLKEYNANKLALAKMDAEATFRNEENLQKNARTDVSTLRADQIEKEKLRQNMIDNTLNYYRYTDQVNANRQAHADMVSARLAGIDPRRALMGQYIEQQQKAGMKPEDILNNLAKFDPTEQYRMADLAEKIENEVRKQITPDTLNLLSSDPQKKATAEANIRAEVQRRLALVGFGGQQTAAAPSATTSTGSTSSAPATGQPPQTSKYVDYSGLWGG